MSAGEPTVAGHAQAAVPGANGGFTLVELIIAVVILAVGVVGLGSSTGWAVRQVTLSDMTLERTAARQEVTEHIRTIDFGSVAAGSETVGSFRVAWTLTQSSSAYKTVQVVTTGPGLGPGPGGTLPVLTSGVTDTLSMRLLAPGF